VIESFFGTLKVEFYHLATIDSIETLVSRIHDCIRYYNQKRIKLGLQGRSPVKYRLKSGITNVQLLGVSSYPGRFRSIEKSDHTTGI
jgi:transposase InsO family protein